MNGVVQSATTIGVWKAKHEANVMIFWRFVKHLRLIIRDLFAIFSYRLRRVANFQVTLNLNDESATHLERRLRQFCSSHAGGCPFYVRAVLAGVYLL